MQVQDDAAPVAGGRRIEQGTRLWTDIQKAAGAAMRSVVSSDEPVEIGVLRYGPFGEVTFVASPDLGDRPARRPPGRGVRLEAGRLGATDAWPS